MPLSYIAAPLSNACIPSSVAFLVMAVKLYCHASKRCTSEQNPAFQLIIEIAALCSGDDNWQSTSVFLAEANVPVPEEVNSVRQALDELMDSDFPRLNRD